LPLQPGAPAVSVARVEVLPASGQFEFTDALVAEGPQRFYRVSQGPLPKLFWARSVIGFSSQYSAGACSAAQALGQPDTYPAYGDIPTAWTTPSQNNPNEFIELGFASLLPATAVHIYETFNPGLVSKV